MSRRVEGMIAGSSRRRSSRHRARQNDPSVSDRTVRKYSSPLRELEKDTHGPVDQQVTMRPGPPNPDPMAPDDFRPTASSQSVF